MTLQEQIACHLQQHQIPFTVLSHPPADSAIDIAGARGTPLAWGGKTLVLKTTRGFVSLAISAANQVDNRKMRKALASSRVRFATLEELKQTTNLVPGCVPPVGEPFFELPLFMDGQLSKQPYIVFTPGTHTQSFQMKLTDYLAWANPTVVDVVR